MSLEGAGSDGSSLVVAVSDGAGLAGVRLSGGVWDGSGFRGPPTKNLRMGAWRAAPGAVRAVREQLAIAAAVQIERREGWNHRLGEIRPGLPVRFRVVDSCGAVAQGEGILCGHPVDESLARQDVTWEVLREFAGGDDGRASTDELDDVAVPILLHLEDLDPAAAAVFIDSWGMCGTRAPQPDVAERIIARSASLPGLEMGIRSRRALRAVASSGASWSDGDWLDSYESGVHSAAERWRRHVAMSTDAILHARFLEDRLQAPYPQAAESAVAFEYFRYPPGPRAWDAVASAGPHVRFLFARYAVRAGDAARGLSELRRIAARDDAPWDPTPAWWGDAWWESECESTLHTRVSAGEAIERWGARLRVTRDPFLAVAAFERLSRDGRPAPGFDVPRGAQMVEQCLERAMEQADGAIAVFAAFEYAGLDRGTGKAWLNTPAVRAWVDAALAEVMADSRVSPARIRLARAMAVRIATWSGSGK